MKLLFTVNTYMPKRDGVQFVTKYLAEGLVKKGHSVDLITRQCKELTEVDDEVINGVHVIRWNALFFKIYIISLVLNIIKMILIV